MFSQEIKRRADESFWNGFKAGVWLTLIAEALLTAIGLFTYGMLTL